MSLPVIKISETACRLPQEAQDWLKTLDRGERESVEIILNNVGEDAFAKQWRQYKADLDYMRNF